MQRFLFACHYYHHPAGGWMAVVDPGISEMSWECKKSISQSTSNAAQGKRLSKGMNIPRLSRRGINIP